VALSPKALKHGSNLVTWASLRWSGHRGTCFSVYRCVDVETLCFIVQTLCETVLQLAVPPSISGLLDGSKQAVLTTFYLIVLMGYLTLDTTRPDPGRQESPLGMCRESTPPRLQARQAMLEQLHRASQVEACTAPVASCSGGVHWGGIETGV